MSNLRICPGAVFKEDCDGCSHQKVHKKSIPVVEGAVSLCDYRPMLECPVCVEVEDEQT